MSRRLFKPFKLQVDRCPWCGHKHDRAMAMPHEGKPVAPQPGHLVLCIACERWSVFQADLTPRRATPEEVAALPVATRFLTETWVRRVKASSGPRYPVQ
jgi:hypothetical protein